MSKIDSSYQFLWHPLHKNDARTHDHTKRALTLIASIAAGVFSLSLAHIIVYALHRRQVKKLPAETRIPSPPRNSSSSSSSNDLKFEQSKSKTNKSASSTTEKRQPKIPAASPSHSTILSDAELARELQAEEEGMGDPYFQQSPTEVDLDAELARELQDKEDEVLSVRLARQLQELENPPVEPPPEEDQDEEMAIARAMSLAEIEKKKKEFAAEIEQEKVRIYNLPTDTEEQVTEAYIQMCTQRFPPLLDAEGLCLLGEAFESRAGSNDLVQAKNAYLRAAKQNHARAHLRLAQGYESGAFGTIDKARAFEFYIKAALRGNAAAQFWVGKWYQENQNDDIGAAQTQHYFRLAAKQEHKLAIVELKKLGITIEELKAVEVPVKEVQTKPKEKTNTSIHVPTPPETSEDSKLEEDPLEDVEGTALYTEAPVPIPKTENEITQIIEIADRGNAIAQFIVGNYFEYHSSPPDLEKAKSYFEKAAQGNNLRALYRLAECYELGIGGERDLKKALKLYESLPEKSANVQDKIQKLKAELAS